MRTLPLLLAATALTLSACGADDPVPERRTVALELADGQPIQLANTHGEVVVQAGWPAELHVWHSGGHGDLVQLKAGPDALTVTEACVGCADLYELVVPPDTPVRVLDHEGPLSALDLDGPLTVQATGPVDLTGLAGPTTLTVAGDVTARGMWSAQFTAHVDGAFDAVWTRPPSAMDVAAAGDLRAVLATYFYAADLTAEGAVDLNGFVPDPGSIHHVRLHAGGDLWVDFGPAQGDQPPRR